MFFQMENMLHWKPSGEDQQKTNGIQGQGLEFQQCVDDEPEVGLVFVLASKGLDQEVYPEIEENHVFVEIQKITCGCQAM